MSVGATTARFASWQSPHSEPAPDFDPGAMELLGLDEEDIESLIVHVNQAAAESLAVLIPDPAAGEYRV